MDGLLAGVAGEEVFEELRFVWELMGAALVFLVPFARPRKRTALKVAAGFLGFSLVSLEYFAIEGLSHGAVNGQLLVGFWYILLSLAIALFWMACFELTLGDALYVAVSSYAAQHIVYVIIHEWLALGVWPALPQLFGLYVMLSEAACLALYTVLYRIFGRRLRASGGRIVENSPKGALTMAALLVMLLSCTFGFQNLFRLSEQNKASAVWMSIVVCLIVLGMQYLMLGSMLEERELAASEQMLADAEDHWKVSNELIENLNQAMHDLKHVVGALDAMSADDREGYVSQTTEYIKQYEATVYSDDEVLNTILSEKALLCDSRGVAFSCSLGKVDLGFFSVPDLYVLLGNIVDNAVEGALTLSDPELRAVSLAIRERGGMACITCDNRFEGERELGEGGLPATTKADSTHHGFGLKSIRAIAERYGGAMTVCAEGGVFTVQVAIPLP